MPPTDATAPATRDRTWTTLVVGMLALGACIASVRLARSTWDPASDLALAELAVRRVGTGHTPLLGAYSRYGWAHPGPALWYLLAPWYRISGARSGALLAGVFLIDLAAVSTALTVLLRRAGARVTCVASLLLLPLLVGIGTNDLLIPWNARVYVLPLLALAVLAWSAGLGDTRWGLASVVAVGAFVAQAHAGTLLLVGLCTLWAIGGIRHHSHRARVLVPALVVGLIVWLPTLIDVIAHRGGNLGTLLGFSLGAEGTRTGYGVAWARLADTLSPRAFWITGQHATVELDGTLSPRGGTPWALAGLVLGLVVAHRQRAQRVVALALLAAAFDLVSLVSVAQVRPPVFPYLVGYLQVAGWLTCTAAFAGLLTALPAGSADRFVRALAPALVVAVVAGLIVTGLRAPAPEPADGALVADLLPDATRGIRDCRAVDVRTVEGYTASGAAQGVALQWVRAGRVVTFDPTQPLEYGPLARRAGADACRVLFTVGTRGRYARARAGDRVLATHDDLEPQERAEYQRLRMRLNRLLDAYSSRPEPGTLASIRRAFATANRRFAGGGGDPIVVVLRARR